MPTYKYKTTINGKVQSGEIEAEDEQGALSKLKQRNITVTSVKKKSESAFLSNKKPITERDVVIFTRQFSTMVDAGLPLVQCLEILGKQADNPAFGEIIMKIKTDIESGSNLSDAMRKHSKVFNSLYANLVEAGEAGGILDTILGRLANYIEKALALKKKVKAAMVYPAAIITVAVTVVAFLMVFVIPTFATMFSSGGAELPGPTALVMDISNFF